MKRNIYFIDAKQYYSVGSAGAIIIAENLKEAKSIASGLGLLDPEKPKLIGKTNLKTQIVFENTTDY